MNCAPTSGSFMWKPLPRNLLTAVAIGLLGSMLVGGLWLVAPNLLNSWEWSTYDARMRLGGPAPANPALVLIGRDDTSEVRFGKGIWDRARFAEVIDGLGRAGAAVVAPDFYFADASPPERGGSASDKALIRATKNAGNVVYPISSPPLLPALAQYARAEGHIVAVSDADGVYRSVPVFLEVEGRSVPALGVASAAVFLRTRPDTMTVPVDHQGRMLINYAGRWEDGPFPYLSFVDVWDAIREGRLDEVRTHVAGKIVVLLHAGTDSDKRLPPREAKAPGGFIHANVINTIATGRSLRVLGSEGAVAFTLGASVLAAVLLVGSPGWAGLGGVSVLALGYAGLAQLVFVRQGLVLPLLAPLLAVVIVLVLGYLLRFVTEQRGRLWMQRAFSQYLGAPVVDRLAREQSALRLGGEERDITVMFADLTNFTKLSTQVQPEVLTRITNRYLGVIVEQVEATGGDVNKFLGDCVMALWGAPSADPQHAVNGVRAALAAVIRIDRERREAEARGEIGFSVKIGLNSGPAFVGNVGSETRFNYTAVGETVNIAARIEGLAGMYACQVVVGPLTAKLLEGEFLLRELDLVRVKGKDEPIAVFEVLADRAAATSDQIELAQVYGQALGLYRSRRFADAGELWEMLARKEQQGVPGDRQAVAAGCVSTRMAARAHELAAHPPASSWNG